MRGTTGSTAGPAARCRNDRRGSFMAFPSTSLPIAGIPRLLRLEPRELDHLGPFLGLVSEEFAELAGGTSGSTSILLAVVTARGRSLPARIYAIEEEAASNMELRCPPIRSVSAG